jgi:hypothetical protein
MSASITYLSRALLAPAAGPIGGAGTVVGEGAWVVADDAERARVAEPCSRDRAQRGPGKRQLSPTLHLTVALDIQHRAVGRLYIWLRLGGAAEGVDLPKKLVC